MSESPAVRELLELFRRWEPLFPNKAIAKKTMEAVIAELEAANEECAALKKCIHRFDESRLKHEQTANQLVEAVTKERDKAQKACAEMREALGEVEMQECLNSHPHDCVCCLTESEVQSIALDALNSTDYGKGYIKASELEPTIEFLHFLSAHNYLASEREPERIGGRIATEIARLEALTKST